MTIPVYTLSFKEYLAFKTGSTQHLVINYFRSIFVLADFRSLRMANLMNSVGLYQIVNGIYHTIVSQRHCAGGIESSGRIDLTVWCGMSLRIWGKRFSASSVSKFLKSEHRTISVESIYNYLRWLEQAFIIYPCRRYDIQGKTIENTGKILSGRYCAQVQSSRL